MVDTGSEDWLRPVHKFLHKKLHLPQEAVRPILSRLRVAGRRADHRLRLALAREILESSADARSIPDAKGYRLFTADELPGTKGAVVACQRVFEEQRSAESPFARKAAFLRTVAHGEDLTRHRELLDFLVSRPLLDAVSGYLGAVPRIANVSLLWSPANDSAESSQLFHLDDEDLRMVKVFVNVWEVTPEHGPLTFMPADASARVRSATGRVHKRATDERVLGAAGGAEPVVGCGGPGDGVFVDTARCLHYGSRGNTRERLVLHVHYLRHDAPSESSLPCRFPPDLAGLAPDRVQRLALGLDAD